jgi:hypothetical protein
MLTTAANIGFPMIGKWTAAKILFVVYKYGGAREEFTYSPKFVAEIDYIKKIYNVDGGEIPDSELAEYLRRLDSENTDEIPQWANDLCEERYGFTLTNVQNNATNRNN